MAHVFESKSESGPSPVYLESLFKILGEVWPDAVIADAVEGHMPLRRAHASEGDFIVHRDDEARGAWFFDGETPANLESRVLVTWEPGSVRVTVGSEASEMGMLLAHRVFGFRKS